MNLDAQFRQLALWVARRLEVEAEVMRALAAGDAQRAKELRQQAKERS